jgi:hypothetical protein
MADKRPGTEVKASKFAKLKKGESLTGRYVSMTEETSKQYPDKLQKVFTFECTDGFKKVSGADIADKMGRIKIGSMVYVEFEGKITDGNNSRNVYFVSVI